MMTNLKRGDIVHVKNPIRLGGPTHIIQGDHYAVIVQNNKGNEHSNAVIVAYMTSNTARMDIPTNCLLQWYDFLVKPSLVLCSQLMTVDKLNIDAVIGHVRPEDEIRINRALRASLALEENA